MKAAFVLVARYLHCHSKPPYYHYFNMSEGLAVISKNTTL